MTTRVSAIVVTRNNQHDIALSLNSLRESRHPIDEIIVIDQDSQDGTVDRVRREFRNAIVIDFLDNPGFGEGNNRGARVASGEYLLLLNPDATVDRDCIGGLVSELDEQPNAAIAVPKILLAAEPSVINSAGLQVNRIGYACDRGYLEWDCGQYDTPRQVLAGSGCAMLVRASVFRKIGGFDARYFLYYEDLDLCWRVWLAGHSVRYRPSAVVRHDMKVSARPLFFDHCLDHRNRVRTLLKNLSMSSLLQTASPILRFEASNVLDLVRRRQWRAVSFRLQAWLWTMRWLPDTLRERRAVQTERTIPDPAMMKLVDPDTGAPQLDAAVPTYAVAYEERLDRSQLSSQVLMGTNDIGALGLGWYSLETVDGRSCRWCCGYGIAFLTGLRPHQPATISITMHVEIFTEVAIFVDRQRRGMFQIDPGGWRDVSVDVPCVGDVVRVDLKPVATFRPADSNPTTIDRRVLGVAVSRIARIGRDGDV